LRDLVILGDVKPGVYVVVHHHFQRKLDERGLLRAEG
jgi:hypothetical protein